MPDSLLAFPPASKSPRQLQLGPLPGQALLVEIARLFQTDACALTGPLIVICERQETVENMEIALRELLPAEVPLASFPDWEILPYDSFSPHEDIVSRRLQLLSQLPGLGRAVVLTGLTTILHRLAPETFIRGQAITLATGDRLDPENWRNTLLAAGYRAVDTVLSHGEYAVRGSILDLFPSGAEAPVRIELFDDQIETLRTFDPETQRSLQRVERVELLPAHEFPLTAEGIDHFCQAFDSRFPEAPRAAPLRRDVAEGIAAPGLEYFLPLFFDTTACFTDYLPEGARILLLGDLPAVAERYLQEVRDRFEQRSVDPLRPLLPPQQVFWPTDELFARLKAWPRIRLNDGGPVQSRYAALGDLHANQRDDQPFRRLAEILDAAAEQVIITAESPGRARVMLENLRDHGLPAEEVDPSLLLAGQSKTQPQLGVCALALLTGYRDQEAKRWVLSEFDLFSDKVPQRRRRRQADNQTDLVVQSLTELKPGSPVVHLDHGVGRYQGLITLDAGGLAQEYLLLHYADDAKLYVPVTALDRISRYAGLDDNHAPLSRLGNDRWNEARRKAMEKARDTAVELLEIYARRDASQGQACQMPDLAYQKFAEAFPFEETPDQEKAIAAVIRDMTQPRPMDRLVCGDVGFGKTEVAMRAAFLAVHSGYQVAVLVPTTLLAQQHYESFRDRFSASGAEVELLSRFRSGKQAQAIEQRMAQGQIDILIGTHKLLQKTMQYPRLGLLIIDEEHRFGVAQKEKLKALRANVDILAMTATPIPRTLNLALQGMRDLSIIATPPARRLSVKTFVRENEGPLIREAVLRETLRGGQVFFLHNEVKTIARRAEELHKLIPEARMAVAHGQMPERELEQVMSDFYHKRFNMLICSTIIETGIDIPSANTIIIERADQFGLAQLHQLRGRVGRSHHQAYAYLLTPPPRSLKEDARQRLEAITLAQDLGAGFHLATHDLEIRGAGELLGDGQSGHIHAVGFSMFMELLEEAVQTLREGGEPDLEPKSRQACEINLPLPCLIPEDYLPDINLRLQFYKRISGCADRQALDALQAEMIDRFGPFPAPLQNLFRQTLLRQRAQHLGIQRIDLGREHAKLEFASQTRVAPMTLVNLIQKHPQKYRLAGAQALQVRYDKENPLDWLATCLDTLSDGT